MTTEKFERSILPIVEQAERDDDALFFVYFSRSDDRQTGVHHGMDSGDALLIVRDLCREFGLEPAVIAEMNLR